MWRLRLRRWLAARRGTVGRALADCWSSPLPPVSTALREIDFLVCDGEMSGVDAARDELLSLGWVHLRGGELQLATAQQHLIRAAGTVGISATVHQLRDCELAEAAPLATALDALLAAAAGCVLVFHHAPLDVAFLDAAARRIYGAPLLMPVVDTLALERRLLRQNERPEPGGALRLAACRERYGLPAHAAHSALADAVATGELLLAQAARRGGDLRLRDLL